MKRLLPILFLLVSLICVNAQESELQLDTLAGGVSFESQKEFYIFGDVAVIGNNILSKDDKDAFNNPLANNDDTKMRYVDIDSDTETFSSSQATLNLPTDFKKIAYAGLYWTATYAYEKGTRKEQKGNYDYRGNGERSTVINQIKFKLPNQEYQDVEGSVIYDGSENVTHAINSPYVCYADVTKLLIKAENKTGDYAVANVKATEGYLSGGSAAGWMLYVVYQSPTDNPKYISTYHGFALVNKEEPLDLTFKNFKSVEKGDVKTSVVLAAIEGDSDLQGDEFAIIKQKDGTFQSLSNGARFQQNFFNSSITNNSIKNRDRLPNSENTLGFDIAKLDIPNYNNTIINNNTSETTLRLKTQSDRFYLYFTAFQTEIAQTYFDDIVQENNPNASQSASVAPEIVRAQPESVPSYDTKEKRKPYRYYKRGLNSKAYKYLKNKKSTAIAGIEGGYYVVAGVFAESARAGKWTSKLIKKGYDANAFINPKNNWNYVYLLRSDTADEAFKLAEELKTNYRYRDAWVLKANLD
ncbi:SPOR domain-containing protein [Olleya sp. R77988]|uniref:SPOR domain-containing protein n=1 Tax=Olleya sp. R77988 TaxID=3093875 RepID=UPI0037CB9ACF